MTNSILTTDQARTYTKKWERADGAKVRMGVAVRYDDRCGNGHNTFSITADIWEKRPRRGRRVPPR